MSVFLKFEPWWDGPASWLTLEAVPKEDRWAFEHIIEHDCGCISVGQTVYQVSTDPDDLNRAELLRDWEDMAKNWEDI